MSFKKNRMEKLFLTMYQVNPDQSFSKMNKTLGALNINYNFFKEYKN